MRSITLVTALVGGCLAVLPAAADAPKNADGGAYAPGDYTGKLVSTPGPDGAFTVAVETDRVVPKVGAAPREDRQAQQLLRNQEEIDKLQAELARSRNPREYARRLDQLSQAMARMQVNGARDNVRDTGDVQVQKTQKNVDFQAADGFKVRTMNPPMQFDDKGNPKKYTQVELDALKGKDKDLPGYEAAPDSLKAGDSVKVTLAAPKSGNDAGKPGNQVTVILIVAEPTNGDVSKNK